jgi:hypothetical protein
MSKQYPGGIISKTAPVPSGNYANSTAPGIWTLEQQAAYAKLGQWPTAGNVDPSAFIENLFSTYLYTGNGSTQTITNGINLSANGGLVWFKNRSVAQEHRLFDTARGVTNYLTLGGADGTNPQDTSAPSLTAFNNNGFNIGNWTQINTSPDKYASWTFREQPKFFDIVTYTGNGTSGRAIPHNLGSAPGFIAVKVLSAVDNWECYHRGITFNSANVLWLNSSNALTTGGARFTSQPTSTDFYVGSDSGVNGSGKTYVAYLFAHDAGGFGASGTDNVISCGSFTTDGSGNATVSLGYEPQWLMVKDTTNAQSWYIEDNMRAFNLTSRAILFPNLSNAEATGATAYLAPNSTGFAAVNGQLNASATYIYVAIRRGPMAVPTLGTSVFSPITSAASTGTTLTTDFPVDLQILKSREAVDATYLVDRLRGVNTTGVTGQSVPYLTGNTTAAEVVSTTLSVSNLWNNTSFKMPSGFGTLSSVFWSFRRAPSFMDVVCYTGTGSTRTVTHNLAAVPELMFVKRRDDSANWIGGGTLLGVDGYLFLNGTGALDTQSAYWANTLPTSSVFTVETATAVNDTGGTYVAYLFATCPGVSKVGSYTGTGAAQTINCGFTGGSRFVLIKRTDSTGDWYVWDSARGIVAGDDPYLLLNSTAAEVTNTDYVDTYSAGFEISSTAPAAINASGGTFIFLAIA